MSEYQQLLSSIIESFKTEPENWNICVLRDNEICQKTFKPTKRLCKRIILTRHRIDEPSRAIYVELLYLSRRPLRSFFKKKFILETATIEIVNEPRRNKYQLSETTSLVSAMQSFICSKINGFCDGQSIVDKVLNFDEESIFDKLSYYQNIFSFTEFGYLEINLDEERITCTDLFSIPLSSLDVCRLKDFRDELGARLVRNLVKKEV